jgi:hypothetical protein
MRKIATLLVSGCLLAGLGQVNVANGETVGERFDTAMKKLAERCEKNPPKLANTDCDPLKLKPVDPLATEEGRYAHSIKVPNPVSEDSGYRQGMTPQEYFDHLCKTEAGEFIFKTVENVAGFLQMRPRSRGTDYELQHLYVLEDPYGANRDESISQEGYVNPPYAQTVPIRSAEAYKLYKPNDSYQFLEKPLPAKLRNAANVHKYLRYTRPNTDKMIIENDLYYYPRDQQPKMIEEQVQELKSRYGFTWRGVTRPHDRELGVAGGELIILDLQTNEVLGLRRGYLRTANIRETGGRVWWLGAHSCPSNLPGVTEAFIRKVLKPAKSLN